MLTSVELFTNTGPEVKSSMDNASVNRLLSCNITEPSSAIEGHKWLLGDKIVKEDTESSTSTSYT